MFRFVRLTEVVLLVSVLLSTLLYSIFLNCFWIVRLSIQNIGKSIFGNIIEASHERLFVALPLLRVVALLSGRFYDGQCSKKCADVVPS